MMSNATPRTLNFLKGRERFVWQFHEGQQQEVVANVRDLAEDPATSLDQQDALVLCLAMSAKAPEGAGRCWAREDHECNLGRERYEH